MRVMCDIDGTINAAVPEMKALLTALHKAGNYIAIVSGSGSNPDSGNTFADKTKYLQSIGVTDCFDDLVVVGGDIPKLKAQWCKDNQIDMAIDNSIPNARSLMDAGVAIVLVPWMTRTKKNETGKK